MILYRLLEKDDVMTLRTLRLHGLKESPRAFLEDYEEQVNKPPEDFLRYFDYGWIAGAFAGEKLVGVAGMCRHKGAKLQHKSTIWGVYVLPGFRGQGVAKKLLL